MKSTLFAAACTSTFASVLMLPANSSAQTRVSADEAREIARDAYIYAYPLVLMEVSGRVATNVAQPPGNTDAPINQFGHARAFPDPSFTVVVRPNADTLYSSLVYDVSREPLVVTVPDSGGRYYLLPVLDKWSDVFAVPGSRTTGNRAQMFAIVGPNWQGELPPGLRRYDSPTAGGWIGGRVQTNGKADYEAVHAFQNGLKAVPLSAYGKPYTPLKGVVNAKLDMSAPPEQLDKMDGSAFFALLAELIKQHPPHANDYPVLDRMKRIGIEPGKSFVPSSQPKEVQEAIQAAPVDALPRIKAAWARAGVLTNGWRTNLSGIGTYGADYLHRAGVAFGGLGANVPDDAVYPTAFADSEGRPFDSANCYVMNFTKEHLPPVRAFWSLTMYDNQQLFTENSIGRYAIGDRDKLAFDSEGSLDLYIRREMNGKEQANWLPAPKSGAFTMNMRLYWPKAEVVEGKWSPPLVKRVDCAR